MDKTWLTANKYFGSGNSTIALTAKANNTIYKRSTTVTGRTSKGKTATIICDQPIHINMAFRDGAVVSQVAPDSCISCGQCYSFQDTVREVCPFGVNINMWTDNNNYPNIEMDAANAERCIGCGDCLRDGIGCPVGIEGILVRPGDQV